MFVKFECQAPLHKRKDPLLTFWRRSDWMLTNMHFKILAGSLSRYVRLQIY